MKLLPPVIALVTASLGHYAHADNLHIDVNCADYWATPDSGLDVRIDGAPATGGNLNEGVAIGYTKHGNPYLTMVPTDIGYTVAPGTHRVTIGAPDCAPLDTQISVGVVAPPAFVSGRLPVSTTSLLGPTGAPNGFGFLIGAYTATRGAHTSTNDLGDSSYSWNDIQTTGGLFSMSYEHRNFALAYDLLFGTGSVTGTTTNSFPGGGGVSAPSSFTASQLQLGTRLRLGYRLPENKIAFAAGSGIGGDAYITTSGLVGYGGDFDFVVPLWASLTIKPACDWGVQLLASYDVHPTDMSESAPSLVAGLQFQPSSSCSEQPGLAVR